MCLAQTKNYTGRVRVVSSFFYLLTTPSVQGLPPRCQLANDAARVSTVRPFTVKLDWCWLRGPDPGATVTKVIMGSLPDPNRL